VRRRRDGRDLLKLCRFDADRLGVVDGPLVRDVTPVLERLPAQRWPAPPGDALISHLAGLRPWIEAASVAAPAIELERVTLRAPVANPGKVIAVRGNYRGNDADDAGAPPADPELFLKAASSVAGAGEGLRLRLPGRRVDHEVELVAVVGQRVDGPTQALQHGIVAGYCIGIDATMRGAEDRGLRKSLDGFTLIGPWLTTADEAADTGSLEVELSVNGDPRQRGNTSRLVHGVPALLAEAAKYFMLQPGDILMSGTPPGVGPLYRGDVVRCSVERLGTLRVEVR
jgi:2-keto-4-pentenoate hydratase/2-oxohepta-3-ene-1,7-dioic acid hydratase in catechol pathway